MEQQNNNQGMIALQQKVLSPQVIAMQDKFLVACQTARDLELTDNACAAFQAVVVISTLRDALTDEVMKQVVMPLMNTKIGFRTDKDPSKPVWSKKDNKYVTPQPYSVDVVRDCVIDALCKGLMITGNQFNIISGTMYTTKEGFTALLKKLGVKYFIDRRSVGIDADKGVAEFSCKITYEFKGQKNGYTLPVTIDTKNGSGLDQLMGKVECRCKKHLYELITGIDLGDGADVQDAQYEEVPAGGGAATIQMPKPQQQPVQQPQQPATPRQAMNNAAAQAENDWRQQAKQQPQAGGPNF